MKNTLTFFFLLTFFWSNAQPGISIENVEVEKLPNNILSITYDLQFTASEPVEVIFRAAAAGDPELDYNTSNAIGQLGPDTGAGVDRNIEWDYSAYVDSTSEFRLMLVAKSAEAVDIQNLVDQVDSSQLIGNLTFMEGIRHRSTGAAHLAETQSFIRNRFLGTNLETTVQSFNIGNYEAQNIIGKKIGTSDESEVYILDGHYDSVSDSPGADDNASAIAGMLEALRVLAPYGFKKSIRFIGFDMEEAGLLGSIEYVGNGLVQGENINGVLNFEMIGFYTDEPNSQSTPVGFSLLFPDAYAQLEADEFRGNFINLVANVPAQPLVAAYEAAAATYVPELRVISIEAPANWSIIAPDLGRSDHAPFWSAGNAAVMLTDGADFRNPYYHTPEDTQDKLNFTFMRQVVQATVATLAELAEIETAATWWTDTDFTTSVQEVEDCQIDLSPNPASGFININWNNCQLGKVDVKLMDISGRVIQKVNGIDPSNRFYQLNISDLKKGIYFIQLTTGHRKWAEKVVFN